MKNLEEDLEDDIEALEKFIKDNSMFYTKREVFNKLPKKMLWGTFKIIINYLEETGKIEIDITTGNISYTWNPELLEKIKDMKSL